MNGYVFPSSSQKMFALKTTVKRVWVSICVFYFAYICLFLCVSVVRVVNGVQTGAVYRVAGMPTGRSMSPVPVTISAASACSWISLTSR